MYVYMCVYVCMYEKRKTKWKIKLTYFTIRILSSEMNFFITKIKYIYEKWERNMLLAHWHNGLVFANGLGVQFQV